MEGIKEEQRIFEHIVEVFTIIYNENINNCQSFLTSEKINEVVSAFSDFSSEND